MEAAADIGKDVLHAIWPAGLRSRMSAFSHRERPKSIAWLGIRYVRCAIQQHVGRTFYFDLQWVDVMLLFAPSLWKHSLNSCVERWCEHTIYISFYRCLLDVWGVLRKYQGRKSKSAVHAGRRAPVSRVPFWHLLASPSCPSFRKECAGDDSSVALNLLVEHGCLVESYGQVTRCDAMWHDVTRCDTWSRKQNVTELISKYLEWIRIDYLRGREIQEARGVTCGAWCRCRRWFEPERTNS